MVSRPRSQSTLAVSLGAVMGRWRNRTLSSIPSTAPKPALADAPKPQLSAEMRGDIFMARKMYREAIETFREGSPKDPVLLNKIGIAYHQMMQLDNAAQELRAGIEAQTGLRRSH